MKRLIYIGISIMVGACGTDGSDKSSGPGPDVHACECVPVDEAHPCEGNAIEVTVKATRPPSGVHVYRDAVFHWEFNSGGQPAYCGRFANGDFWIAPKAGASVQITKIAGNGTIAADDDPLMEELGLLDQSTHGVKNADGTFTTIPYGNWKPEYDIVPKLPQTFSDVTSVVAAKKRDEANDSVCGTKSIIGACVDAYHVVTVLNSVPTNLGADMLRPNITGKTKEFLRLSDFDFSRLPNSPILEGTDTAGWEEIRQRWSHSVGAFGLWVLKDDGKTTFFSEGARAFRAAIVHSDYGEGQAQTFNNDLMRVFSADNPWEEKRQAVAAMLSFGLDIYHSRYDPPDGRIRVWSSGAGQWHGQFLPAVFLAALLTEGHSHAGVLSQVGPNVHAENQADRGPSELRQLTQGVDPAVYLWGEEPKFGASQALIEGGYWSALLRSQCFDNAPGTCNINVGKKTEQDPYGYIDGPPNLPGANYMVQTVGANRAFAAAMLLMPEICSIVNHPGFMKYVDRVYASGAQVEPDPCVTPDVREDPVTCDAYRDGGTGAGGCVYYGKTWGPDGSGSCIKTPTAGYTNVGRFDYVFSQKTPEQRILDPGYSSPQVEQNWGAIRALNTCP